MKQPMKKGSFVPKNVPGVGVGWGVSCRGGVGCVMQGWGGSCRGGVGHVGVGVVHAGVWWGGVGHLGVGWVM